MCLSPVLLIVLDAATLFSLIKDSIFKTAEGICRAIWLKRWTIMLREAILSEN